MGDQFVQATPQWAQTTAQWLQGTAVVIVEPEPIPIDPNTVSFIRPRPVRLRWTPDRIRVSSVPRVRTSGTPRTIRTRRFQ